MSKSKTAPVVLITGTSTGVGLHTAIAFAMAGYQTIATMRDTSKKDELLALAKANGVKIKVERLDVQKKKSIESCVKKGAAEVRRHRRAGEQCRRGIPGGP